MARLIGEKPRGAAEEIVYDYVMKQLPDYIYAVFAASFPSKYNGHEVDFALFIPHMGVFVMEICAAQSISVEDGTGLLHYSNGMTRPWRIDAARAGRYAMKVFLQENFHINPFIYEMHCFPLFDADKETRDTLRRFAGNEFIFFREDMSDPLGFLLTLHHGKVMIEKLLPSMGYFHDLDDKMAYIIYKSWETGTPEPARPNRPPTIFLSYNRMNERLASEIKQALEKRQIFTWRAPEDVPLGESYLEMETKAIKECDAFVILLSTSSQESKEVLYEFKVAQEAGKKILPIIVEDFTINEFYQEALTYFQYKTMLTFDDSMIMDLEVAIRRAAYDKKT